MSVHIGCGSCRDGAPAPARAPSATALPLPDAVSDMAADLDAALPGAVVDRDAAHRRFLAARFARVRSLAALRGARAPRLILVHASWCHACAALKDRLMAELALPSPPADGVFEVDAGDEGDAVAQDLDAVFRAAGASPQDQIMFPTVIADGQCAVGVADAFDAIREFLARKK